MSSVNDILANQKQLSSAIENLYSNFKKDGESRKTAAYIKKRLDILDNYWFEYEGNFAKLMTMNLEPHMRDYIEKDKENVSDRYGNVRAHILSCQGTAEERPPSPLIKPPTFMPKPSEIPGQDRALPSGSKAAGKVSTGSESRTEEMLKKQTSNFKAFHRTLLSINLDTVSEKWEFEDLLQTIQSRWAAIDSLHWELDSQLDGSNEEYERAFSSYESKYQAIKKAINKKLWSTAHIAKSTPQMEIPSFSGNYNNWTSFKDLFNETIHSNNSISKAQKMQYLKSKVKGEAERLIQHLQVSSDNYDACWNILNQRYNNKKLIFMSHMNILTSLPNIQQQSVSAIKRLHDTTQECLNAIKNLGVDIDSWDPIIVYLLTQKLDSATYTDYLEAVKCPRELPDLKEFLEILEAKFTSLESLRKSHNNSQNYQIINKNQPNKINHKSNYKSSFTSSKTIFKSPNNKKVASSKYKCLLCNSNEHGIYFCQQFLEMSPYNRMKTVTKLNLCVKCLNHHPTKQCDSDKLCRECNKGHNRLLHEALAQSHITYPAKEIGRGEERCRGRGGNSAGANNHVTAGESTQSSSHVSLHEDPCEVLLPTAMIKVQAANGSHHVMRVLLDQGSQTSIITERAAQLLKIPRQRCKGVISGVGAKDSNCKGLINIKCFSRTCNYSFETDALIMKNLIKNLPTTTFSKPDWSYLKNISLADPDFYKSRPVEILLGADIYSNILMDGICRGDTTLPTAQQTQLGWILSGNVKTFQCNVVLNNLDDIQKFWEIEDVTDSSELSLEDQHCLKFYQDTTRRGKDGRYEVRLPLKPEYEEKLGDSKSKAIAQFYQLERKINKQPDTLKSYHLFMNEYLELKHMTPASGNSTPDCYLPHHCVHREDSTTTKLRVVFNASARTSSGMSLNDLMYRGPNLQQDLQNLIIKWRQYQFAYTADLEKMFRQIQLHPEDQKLQKIIWRLNQSNNLGIYQLTTVTYGTKAAPFLAMMTLKQLANDEKCNYPNSQAIEALGSSFYMDDLVHGSHTPVEAKQLQSDLIKILKSGGFNIRKWKSNLPEMLTGVSKDSSSQEYDFRQAESSKTLGLRWNPEEDQFRFQLQIPLSTLRPTKRSLLSDTSKLFDPLGWLSPITIKLKILFQDVWKENLGWDDPLPRHIWNEWERIKVDLRDIDHFQIPRWLKTQKDDQIELHGFCDASTKAYASVIYIKIQKETSPSSVILVAGKARLAPASKTISLPRLELCGALLLSKLMSKMTQCLNNYNIKIYGWIDSMVVLSWLNGDVDRWKPFVANRVRKVLGSMPAECWRYVNSKDNPADCASRGLSVSQLRSHQLWWNGPAWLPTCTPENKKEIYTTNEDMRKIKQVNVMLSNNNEVIKQVVEKQSSLTKATRILAWVLRFISKTEHPKQQFLTLQEINKAKILIIKCFQQENFIEEIYRLKENKNISSTSKIFSLNPKIDESGILRVGGRLKHANIDPDMKYPVIIPNNTRLSDLIIDEAHKLTFHGGPRLTTAFIRRKYWLIGGNNATKKRLRLCVQCRKHSPILQHQLMGDLPEARTNPSRPFYHCGIDYTGHVTLKATKGRGIKTSKGYVAVFVCMATKAIHLELVSDLTSSAFLAALRRMAARRGVPGHIYSDQGKNFIGADKILRQELKEIKKTFNSECMTEITSMGIEWHFNAPSWPSAGGLWEAAVKSLKHHLKRVIGDQNLTFEEFTTLLNQLEGCLNSRPLCPLTEDPDDLDFLTPSHFLSSGPVLTLYDTENDLRTRWHMTQKIYNDIWNRWREEYLTLLSARSKWRKSQPNIQLNDVVIIKDDNLPPGKWALGRVVKLHPGNDGLVRVVTLKTKNGIMQRPVVKLSLLPVNQNYSMQNDSAEKLKDQQNILTKRKRPEKTFSFLSICMYIFLLFMTLLTSSHAAYYNIKSLPNNNSLYFDSITNMHLIRDDWRLIVYYDMFPYQQGNTAVAQYIKYLENICAQIRNVLNCDGIVLQLRHEFSELKHNDLSLMNQQKGSRGRGRRGLINGIGYLANDMFGVLDERFAKKYENDISILRENQNHLALLWKNQTSIAEAELNLLKRTESIMDKHHKMINQRLNSIENSFNVLKTNVQNLTLFTDFFGSAIMANNLLFTLKNIQGNLMDTLSNLYNGRLNLHLITPSQLREELNVIAGQVPKDLATPIENIDLPTIYNLLRIKARMLTDYLIFEIKIPLIGRDRFEILKIIPIPHQYAKTMITMIPVSNYAAVNLHKDLLIELTEQEIKSCMVQDSNTILCHLDKQIYHIKNDQALCSTKLNSKICKTNMTPCENQWLSLSKLNNYFYFCCDLCQLKLLCGDHVTLLQLTNAGIFSIAEGCMIKSADFFMFSHYSTTYTSKINVSLDAVIPEISSINHIVNLTIPSPSLLPSNTSEIADHRKEIRELQERLEMVKQSEPLIAQVSYHDVHHYVLIYSIVALLSVIGIIFGCRRYIRQRPSATGDSSASTATCASTRRDAEAQAVASEPQPASASDKCFKSSVNSVKDKCKRSYSVCESESVKVESARVIKQNRGTSPVVLRSVFTVDDSNYQDSN